MLAMGGHSGVVAGTLGLLGGLVGAAMAGSVGALLGSWLDDNRLYPLTRRSVFDVRQRITERRMQLLADRDAIAASRKRVMATVTGPHQTAALGALEASEAATAKQLVRYDIELWRIELSVWNNRIEPIADGWQQADHAACERWLGDLLAIMHDGRELRDRWSTSAAAQDRAGQRAIAAVTEAEQVCDTLRQALLVRQAQTLASRSPGIDAAYALGTRSPIDPETLTSSRLAQELQTLVDVVPDLENEAVRLHAEVLAIDELGVDADDDRR